VVLRLIRGIEFSVGDFLCRAASPFKRRCGLPEEPDSILAIRDWSLGESLLALPVLASIKKRFPRAAVDVLVTPSSSDVFAHQPFVREIIELGGNTVARLLSSGKRYDVAMDMMPYFRHSALIAFRCARFTAGFDTFPVRSKLYDRAIPFDDAIHMVRMFDRFNLWDSEYRTTELVPLHRVPPSDPDLVRLLASDASRIGVHLGTAQTAPWRAWRYDNFRDVIRSLLSNHPRLYVFLTGSSAEEAVNRRMIEDLRDVRIVRLDGRLTLFELADVMTRLDGFLSSDTGPMHLAAAMGCPTIGLFGPNTPVRFGPFPPDRHRALYMPPPGYRPTINVHKGEFGSRSDAGNDVINRITPRMVMEEAERLLGGRRGTGA
jgi:ADP-heptose:LPS heptosyltransferase